MTTKPTGGQAFPTGLESHPSGTVVQWPELGMTLRQWYAGQALAAIIAKHDALKPTTENGPEYDVPALAAKGAFMYADAMIAEGEKPDEIAVALAGLLDLVETIDAGEHDDAPEIIAARKALGR